MNYHPDRMEVIRSKFLAIELRAHKARHLSSEQEEEIKKHYRIISAIINELWVILNTSEDKGKEWGWWE